MNATLFKRPRVFTLILLAFSLLMVTEMTAQTLAGGGRPPTKPKPIALDPPDVHIGDSCAFTATSNSSTLAIYLRNFNNTPVGVSSLTLDINPFITYTTVVGTIPANGVNVFYVTFDNGVTIQDVFGLGAFDVDINFDMLIGTFPNITVTPISLTASYCVVIPPPSTGGATIGGHGDDDDGPVDEIGRDNRRLASTKDISVNPNPTAGDVSINFEIPEDETSFSAVIYNSLGQEVKPLVQNSPYMKGNYSEHYDISELDNGMYFLVIRIGEEMKTISVSKL